jgi:N-acetylated-alpha-linked acidic dipeptidase
LEALRERRIERARTDEEKKELHERADLRIAALGSGSDYTPFIQHLGIAALNTGFGGDSSGGIYHSVYDSFHWYTKFSDGTFEYGRALAQLNGTIVMRLANAEVLPFEFGNFAETVNGYIDDLEKLGKTGGSPKDINFAPLRSGAKSVSESARRYEEALAKAGVRNFQQVKDAANLNKLIYQSERKLTNAQGLPRRPWFQHQIYAPGFYTGYGVKTIPGVREAIEQKQWSEVEPQMKKAVAALQSMASQIDAAARMLEGK